MAPPVSLIFETNLPQMHGVTEKTNSSEFFFVSLCLCGSLIFYRRDRIKRPAFAPILSLKICPDEFPLGGAPRPVVVDYFHSRLFHYRLDLLKIILMIRHDLQSPPGNEHARHLL